MSRLYILATRIGSKPGRFRAFCTFHLWRALRLERVEDEEEPALFI